MPKNRLKKKRNKMRSRFKMWIKLNKKRKNLKKPRMMRRQSLQEKIKVINQGKSKVIK